MTTASTTVYLFAGDGLTEGAYGESYVERVAKALYQGRAGLEGEVVNSSRGLDTVQSLLDRIDEPLRRYQPRWLILAVGINDIWLPWLSSRSLGWRLWFAYQRLMRGQATTADLDDFAAAYRAVMDKAQALSHARVLSCTVSPVGEQLASPVNQQLARINGSIKHVAADRQAPVADIWQAFVGELTALPRQSRYVPGEWLLTLFDRRRLRTASPDELSRRRRLLLTFDGIHLNTRGADLWADTVVNALAQAEGVAIHLPPSLAQQPDLLCFAQGPLRVCATPGWEARARDLARLVAGAYRHLSSLVGIRPTVYLAMLSEVHWARSAGLLPYPTPGALWDEGAGTVFVPVAYTDRFLHEVHLPETLVASTKMPTELEKVGELARATAVADLLAVQELARLFLRGLRIAPADPALDRLLAAYLTEVVLRAREGDGAAAMAGAWDAWGEVLARHGIAEGHTRVQARALYEQHGDSLAASLATHTSAIREQAGESAQPAESA
jgi:lysophospholipase L1-like esterase